MGIFLDGIVLGTTRISTTVILEWRNPQTDGKIKFFDAFETKIEYFHSINEFVK